MKIAQWGEAETVRSVGQPETVTLVGQPETVMSVGQPELASDVESDGRPDAVHRALTLGSSRTLY